MALATTIRDLVERQRIERSASPTKTGLVQAWQADILEVLRLIRSTIGPYEQDGTAMVATDTVALTEAELGTYDAAQLAFVIAGRGIVVAPVARITIGGTGRIDMYRDDRPSELDRFLIVRDRPVDDGQDGPWLIENKDDAPPDALLPQRNVRRAGRRYYALSGPAVESAIEYLLTME